MKALTFVLLVLASGISEAESFWHTLKAEDSEVFTVAYTYSVKDPTTMFAVRFDKRVSCKPRISIVTPLEKKSTKTTTLDAGGKFHVRIDKKPVWSVKGTFDYVKGSKSAFLQMGIAKKTLRQLMEGDNVRIKLDDDEGDNVEYDTFSLSGSTKAITKALQLCLDTSTKEENYFQKTPVKRYNSEEDFF